MTRSVLQPLTTDFPLGELGTAGEYYIFNQLQNKGLEVHLTTPGHPFDLWAEEYRCDIKTSFREVEDPYKFSLRGHAQTDFYILVIWKHPDKPVFTIPACEVAGQANITLVLREGKCDGWNKYAGYFSLEEAIKRGRIAEEKQGRLF